MGKGDQKSKRGKINRGSHGKRRLKAALVLKKRKAGKKVKKTK